MHHDKDWLIVEKEKFDKDYDKNGDGILAGNEILSWIVPSNEYDIIIFIKNYQSIANNFFIIQIIEKLLWRKWTIYLQVLMMITTIGYPLVKF